jgi:hypothetical protein
VKLRSSLPLAREHAAENPKDLPKTVALIKDVEQHFESQRGEESGLSLGTILGRRSAQ